MFSFFLASFRNSKVSTKSLISPIIIIIFLLIVGVESFISTANIKSKVSGITEDLAPDAGTAANIMEQIYRKRLQVKDYIKTSHVEAIEKFDLAEHQLSETMAKAKAEISNPERVKLLKEIEALNASYNDAFHNSVVANMNRRHELVNTVLNVKGPFIEKSLSQVMASAFDDLDAAAAYHAGQAQKHLLLARLYVFRFLTDNDDKSKARVLAEFAETNSRLKSLLAELQNYERRRLTNESIEALAEYQRAFDQVVIAISERNEAIDTILDKNGPIIAEKAVTLRDSVFSSLSEQGTTIHDRIKSTQVTISVLTLSAIVIGLVIAYAVRNGIIKPLVQTNLMLSDIANGEGDLTKRVEIYSTDEVGELGTNFNQFVAKLQKTIKQVSDATLQLASASEEMATVTAQTSHLITEQKNETIQVASAITQMTATVKEVANNTTQASDAASLANDEAKVGEQDVSSTINSIQSLAQEMNRSAMAIDKVNNDSENISTVLDVIKGVAEQTNLLALNAAIEAARAGEKGRGFAVVADEVRTLAQRTQESAIEIEELITNLQSGSVEAVHAMGNSRELADSTVQQAEKTGQSLHNITRSIDTILQMNLQIASAAEQQSAVSEDINRNICSIENISEETATAAMQTTNASHELAQLGEELRLLVGQFKI